MCDVKSSQKIKPVCYIDEKLQILKASYRYTLYNGTINKFLFLAVMFCFT